MKKRFLESRVVLGILYALTLLGFAYEIEGYNNPSSCLASGTLNSDDDLSSPTTDLQFKDITPMTATCFGVSDGSISLSVSGGTAPYAAFLSGGITSLPPIMNIPKDSTELFSGLAASAISYFVTVIDSDGGMVTSGSITLWPPDPINITVVSTPAIRSGGKSGSMTVRVTDALAPSRIVLQDCNGMTVKTVTEVSKDVTETISGLAAGLYSLTVTGADGCFTTVLINVQRGQRKKKRCEKSCAKTRASSSPKEVFQRTGA